MKQMSKVMTKQEELNEALIEAVKRSDHEAVKSFLDKGADVHGCGDYTLQWAAKQGHLEVVKLLLEHGAEVRRRDDYALRWAAQNGHQDIVDLLKKRMK